MGTPPAALTATLSTLSSMATPPGTAAQSMPRPAFRQNSHKSCDSCKSRKVKCPNSNYPGPCGNCVRRKTPCHFGTKKVPRRNVTKHLRLQQLASAPAGPSPVSESQLQYIDAPPASPRLPQPAKAARPGKVKVDRLDDSESEGSNELHSEALGYQSAIPRLHVDRLMWRPADVSLGGQEEWEFIRGTGIFGGSYSLTFFSDTRLKSLSRCLRNNKVNDVVQRINAVIAGRLRRSESYSQRSLFQPSPGTASADNSKAGGPSPPPAPDLVVDRAFADACVRCYFERAHSTQPFLDREAFEARAADPDLTLHLARNKAWSALYHSILAVGCLYTDTDQSSSFDPEKGLPWRLYAVALANFTDLLLLPDASLLALQALTAMATYGLGVACMSIERVILSEGARRAQSLANMYALKGKYPPAGSANENGAIVSENPPAVTPTTATKLASSSRAAFQRTFWVLYGIEKFMSFHFGRSSAFVDSDIACPIPTVPNNPYFLVRIRYARLLSRTYASLFSASATVAAATSGVPRGRSAAESLIVVEQLLAEMEMWRQSIPGGEKGGPRPARSELCGGPVSLPSASSEPTSLGNATPRKRPYIAMVNDVSMRFSVLMLSYMYHSLALILGRAKLYHLSQLPSAETAAETAENRQQKAACNQAILSAARIILGLTPYIEVEAYTPLWILCLIPLMALFVLFDDVIHHPDSPDVAANLSLLDIGAGYFNRIAYTSGNILPGSLISEFAYIAREYIRDHQHGRKQEDMPSQADGPTQHPSQMPATQALGQGPTRRPHGQQPGLASSGAQQTAAAPCDMRHPAAVPLADITSSLNRAPLPTPLDNNSPVTTTAVQQQQQQQQQQEGGDIDVEPVVQSTMALPPSGGATPVSLAITDLMGGNFGPTLSTILPDLDPVMGDGEEYGGTDVMGLFSYFMPDEEPALFDRFVE